MVMSERQGVVRPVPEDAILVYLAGQQKQSNEHSLTKSVVQGADRNFKRKWHTAIAIVKSAEFGVTTI